MMQERGKKRFLHHFVVVAGQIREKMPAEMTRCDVGMLKTAAYASL